MSEILSAMKTYFEAPAETQAESLKPPATITTVDGVYNAIKDFANHRNFIYFVASNNESGESWCPDCRRCNAIYYNFIQNTINSFKTLHYLL